MLLMEKLLLVINSQILILLFVATGVLFITGGILASILLSKSNPGDEKNAIYECGEASTGNAWLQFNFRFYSIGLIFIIFDVEILLLFPWASAFNSVILKSFTEKWTSFAFWEVTVFLFFLLPGLLYIIKNKDIDWIKPKPSINVIQTKIPAELYQSYNKKH